MIKNINRVYKQTKRILNSRFFITAIILLAQFLLWFFGFYAFTNISRIAYTLSLILSIVIIIYLLNKHDNPSYKIAWCIIILIVPYIGGLIYLLFGGKKVPKKLSKRILSEYDEANGVLIQKQEYKDNLINVDDNVKHIFNLGQVISDYPYCQNSSVSYLKNGEIFYQELMSELNKAQKFIFMEYFIIDEGYMLDSIIELLRKKVADGVDVYFMYDDGGCVKTIDYHYYKKLCNYGIKATIFNPITLKLSSTINNRDHRKITVIDNKVAFMGGVNLADEYINVKKRFGKWKDCAIKIKGEAVFNCTVMFMQFFNASSKSSYNYNDYKLAYDTNEAKDFVLAFSDTPTDDDLVGRSIHMAMIRNAKRYLYIQTPYLILDYDMTNALINAAKSGVEVIITTPGIPDKKLVYLVTRYNYRLLLKNGIKIYEYTPGFIHSKVIICDDLLATVGTINIDYRSYYLNYECATLFTNKQALDDIRDDFIDTLKVCEEVVEHEYKKINVFMRVAMMIANIFSPLF